MGGKFSPFSFWDLMHFSVVLVMPQMYHPHKWDFIEKGNEQAFQLQYTTINANYEVTNSKFFCRT